ncbi:hypothetical protein JYQ62_22620 [Nostoc sp. UHCC 0702]|nr:hypothetical protein JYQ62_22620 [Nostoc sp. UHCC 0702]
MTKYKAGSRRQKLVTEQVSVVGILYLTSRLRSMLKLSEAEALIMCSYLVHTNSI